MEGTSVIASIITEIRRDMSDKEFSAALNTFTKGEYHPATNTIQKYRTGQREPSYCDLQKILAYSEAGDHLSHGTATRLAEFFGIPQLAQRADESAQVAHHLLPGSLHLSTSGKVDELAQTHLSDLTQQLQMRPQRTLVVVSFVIAELDHLNGSVLVHPPCQMWISVPIPEEDDELPAPIHQLFELTEEYRKTRLNVWRFHETNGHQLHYMQEFFANHSNLVPFGPFCIFE